MTTLPTDARAPEPERLTPGELAILADLSRRMDAMIEIVQGLIADVRLAAEREKRGES